MKIRFTTNVRVAHALAMTSLLAASCGGSGGSSSSDGPRAPSGLVYAEPAAHYAARVEIEPNVPTVQGTVQSWRVQPELPAGLELDADTGAIRGTPQEPTIAALYRVTARGPGGKARFDLEIGVTGSTRFLYAAHPSDDTVSIYTVDAFTGRPAFYGYQVFNVQNGGIEELVVHPQGAFAFEPQIGSGGSAQIIVHSIDPANGRLTPAGSAPIGMGPHRLQFGPEGTLVHATAGGTDEVWTYAFDLATGALDVIGTTATGEDPDELAVDPRGRFVYVVNTGDSSLSIYRVQPDGSLFSNLPPRVFPTGLRQVVFDPKGTRAYVTVEGRVSPLRIDPQSGDVAEETGLSRAVDDIVMHPSGRFAFVTSEADGELSVLAIGEDGSLTEHDSIAAGSAPFDLTLDAAGAYAYVVDRDTGEVRTYAIDGATGTVHGRGAARTRRAPERVSFASSPYPSERVFRNLYMVALSSAEVLAYGIDTRTDTLTSVGSPAATQTSPQDIAFDALGRFGWVSNLTNQTITVLRLDPDTGAPESVGSPHALPGRPRGVAVDPSGRYLYVVLEDTDELHSLAINRINGTLTALDAAAVGEEPRFVAVDPTGSFVYTSSFRTDDIVGYALDSSGSFVGPPLVAQAPSVPQEMRFSPRGDIALVPLKESHVILPYRIDPVSGALTLLAQESHTTSLRPGAVVFSPDERFAYAAVPGKEPQVGHLEVMSFDPVTGNLEGIAEIPGGINPWDMAIAPNGRYVFTCNRFGHDVDLFTIDEDGALVWESSAPAGMLPQAIAVTSVMD
ncbi:MAG: lactonase family protein [bacterium]|nr:lactonase family protein [bacterium]